MAGNGGDLQAQGMQSLAQWPSGWQVASWKLELRVPYRCPKRLPLPAGLNLGPEVTGDKLSPKPLEPMSPGLWLPAPSPDSSHGPLQQTSLLVSMGSFCTSIYCPHFRHVSGIICID